MMETSVQTVSKSTDPNPDEYVNRIERGFVPRLWAQFAADTDPIPVKARVIGRVCWGTNIYVIPEQLMRPVGSDRLMAHCPNCDSPAPITVEGRIEHHQRYELVLEDARP